MSESHDPLELAILGCLLIEEPETWILEQIKAAHFYGKRTRDLFEYVSARRRDGVPVDLTLCLKDLRKKELTDIWMMSMAAPFAAPALPHYVAQLRSQYAARMIKRILVANEGNLAELDRAALEELLAVTSDQETNFPTKTAGDLMPAVMEELEALAGKEPPMPFGIRDLDTTLWGAHEGELMVIGAYTGVGKTTVLTNFAYNLAEKNHSILYFSTELSGEQFSKTRLLPMASGVSADLIRKNKVMQTDRAEWTKISEGASKLSKLPFLINDYPDPDLGRIRAAIRENRPKCVFVDYIGRCKMPKSESRTLAVSEFVKGLKNLARKERVPIVAAAQLNRDSKANPNARPGLWHLRESGGIEIEADVAVLLHQPDPAIGKIEMIVAKNRHGGQAIITVMRNDRLMTIAPVHLGDEPDDLPSHYPDRTRGRSSYRRGRKSAFGES